MKLKIPSKIEFSKRDKENKKIKDYGTRLKEIEFKDIPKFFLIEKVGNKFSLKVGRAKPIIIEIPFKLDIEIAKICGMIPDGHLSKDFSCVSFAQVKDIEKTKEFGEIIKRKFNLRPRYEKRDRCWTVTISNKSLCYFLHYCIDIYKSDQNARTPKWIFESNLDIIREYLRYAFAMEGSISDPLKGEKEIKFHSCDKSFLLQLSRLLLNKFKIDSHLQIYKIKNYGEKYYLSITNKENIFKFSEIGFALKSHQERLEKVIKSYKAEAWKITLLSISKLDKKNFTIKDVNKLFPYLSKRAVHQRLKDLVKVGFLIKLSRGYMITQRGLSQIQSLYGKISITKLRTNPKENEKLVFQYLMNKEASISQIARDLNIHVKTIGDVLERLKKKGKVKL